MKRAHGAARSAAKIHDQRLVASCLAEEIVDSAPCPVLTIGPHVPRVSGPNLRLQDILYATDLLHRPGKALEYALWLAELDHARLTLLHVMKQPANYTHSRDSRLEVESKMKELARLLPSEGTASVEAECIVEMGVPADQILKVAEKQGADVIVVGPPHTAFTRIAAHLPWITPHKVICHAPCPVLTLRE